MNGIDKNSNDDNNIIGRGELGLTTIPLSTAIFWGGVNSTIECTLPYLPYLAIPNNDRDMVTWRTVIYFPSLRFRLSLFFLSMSRADNFLWQLYILGSREDGNVEGT